MHPETDTSASALHAPNFRVSQKFTDLIDCFSIVCVPKEKPLVAPGHQHRSTRSNCPCTTPELAAGSRQVYKIAIKTRIKKALIRK